MTQPLVDDGGECKPPNKRCGPVLAPEPVVAMDRGYPEDEIGPFGAAWSRVPGSFGELIQGRFDGRDVLISCPVDRPVSVQARLTRDGLIHGLEDAPRSRRLLTRLLGRYAPAGTGARIQLDSPLSRGKGMASSTADLSGVAGAVLTALGESSPPSRVAGLVAAMEPSDSIMHPGLVLMDRHTGEVLEHYPAPPPLTLIGLDAGGRVDTLGFHRPEHEQHRARQVDAFAEAVAATREGLESGCASTLAVGSTLSARLNQSILPNPLLEPVEHVGQQVGAHGVCIAHSGTIVGLLMPPEPERVTFALTRLRARVGSHAAIETFTPIAGGLVTESLEGELPDSRPT